MAAWTLPKIVADCCEVFTTALDQRNRRYLSLPFSECCWAVVAGLVAAGGRSES